MLRKLQFAVLAVALAIAAFSTGADFLFFLLYLGMLVIGGGYLVTRFGLSDLEAGYVLDRLHGNVGDTLRTTYTVRNVSRLPKLWLEVYSPSNLPVPMFGRALSLGPRSEQSWVAKVPLTRRGQYRVEPMVVRTGDPFGLFESFAAVGSPSSVVVYPQVEALPRWWLPPASIEGAHASPERSLQTTAMATTIRPYVPGDAYNRIHWRSSARQQELQVKEFDLEQTADVWIFLDLDQGVQTGQDDLATIETAVRVAASIAARALSDSRAVGFSGVGTARALVPPDRGPRQHQKLLTMLAAVNPDGNVPLREVLVDGLARLRRGMTAVVITPSLARDWIRPLSTLRGRGVAAAVCIIDPLAHEEWSRHTSRAQPMPPTERETLQRSARAQLHALAEYDLQSHSVVPGTPLGEQIVSHPIGAGAAR